MHETFRKQRPKDANQLAHAVLRDALALAGEKKPAGKPVKKSRVRARTR